MKSKIIISNLFIFIVILFSCKNKEEQKESEVIKVNPNTLKVEVNAVFEKDDELILFWKDRNINYFDAKNTIYAGVKGSMNSQKILFEFEEGVIVNDIRLDISSKVNQSAIVISSIKISQQNRQIIISKDKFDEYFLCNDFVTFDSKNGIITVKQNDKGFDPYFTTKQKFLPEFEKIQNTVF